MIIVPATPKVAAVPFAFDAVAAGASGTTSLSWTHTTTASVVLVFVAGVGNAGTTPVVSATYGGTSMGAALASTTGWSVGTYGGYTGVFGMTNPPTGAQTVAVSISNGYTFFGNSVSYTGATIGAASTTYGSSNSLSQTVSSAAGEIVVQAFGGYFCSFTVYGQTSRFINANFMMIGDAAGATSVTFTGTKTGGTTYPAGGAAVRLTHA